MAPSRNSTAGKRRPGGSGTLRIIGGQWRARQLRFIPAEGVRPTADRIRETLFNWLTPVIRDARCLDLFSGSGALGLEALSRGAVHCDFVDINPDNIDQINLHLSVLGARAIGESHLDRADTFLDRAPARSTPYDIVFIDPPFGRDLVGQSCELLVRSNALAADAFVYIEMSSAEIWPELPVRWHPYRQKSTSGVAYRLYQVCSEPVPAQIAPTPVSR